MQFLYETEDSSGAGSGLSGPTDIEQPAVVRQILDHPGIPLPSSTYRSPPLRRTPDSCGEAAGYLGVSEVAEWTYEPVKDDLPLPDPLTL